jgi:hypothetical protein
MKSTWRYLCAALAAVLCAGAYAVPYPNEEQFRKAIENAASVLKAEDMRLEVHDAQKVGLAQPLMGAGLNVSSGTCLIFFNTKPEDGLTQVFDAMPAKDLPIWLGAIAVHEATHCIEQREAYVHKRFEKVLPPGLEHDGMTIQGYLSVVQSGAVTTWGEALADISSLLYLKKTVPDQWLHFAKGIAAMRRDLAWKWPAHDTSPWLNQVIAANPQLPADEDMFETAFELRRQFRPK